VRLENCIVTDNRALTGKGDDLYIGNAKTGCPITGCETGFIELVHSCFDEEVPFIYWDYQGGWGWRGWVVDFYGQGNIAADPLFATPGYWDPNGTENDPNDDFWVDGDYHLQSQAGRWHADDRTWVQDDATSPCIDAGHRNTALGLEPFPNGGVINIGAYGGTVEASRSYFGAEPCSTIMTGDINGDCKVDLQDLELLVSHWLWQGEPYEPEPIAREVYYSE